LHMPATCMCTYKYACIHSIHINMHVYKMVNKPDSREKWIDIDAAIVSM